MTTNPLLSNELLHEIETAAMAQNQEPAEVLSDAVRKYLEDLEWAQFVENNERRARAMGITEDDVDRLIAEVRSENAPRGQ